MKKIFSIILFIFLLGSFSAQAGIFTYVEATNASSAAKKAQKETEILNNEVKELKQEIKELQTQIQKILDLMEKKHEETEENSKR